MNNTVIPHSHWWGIHGWHSERWIPRPIPRGMTILFFAFAGIFVGVPAHRASADDEPRVAVTVKQELTAGQLTCRYQVANQTHMALVGFGVGSNADGKGPYELAALPINWKPSPTGYVLSGTDTSPSGWSPTVFGDQVAKKYAIDWEVTEYENGIMPGNSLDGFVLAFPASVKSCSGVHWKAVTRESEVLSGSL